ncbi:dihydrofolate reductase family protein [Agromyces aurantiacus]|uniref:Dihydrofolate reductase family protein n=1 Tax=Agromyces aurantiacus TaxID=165814 RepID=A0ABV9R603_9MICO|nr:dihydrofolate reductase family protein [Agromyces aurantiacus]MBM7503599.1 dihydrofolate reductase [Agromyces aurantiacus]
MAKVIVIQFITLDGVVEDPDGRGGTAFGGWAFRFGPEAIAGDKFRLGPTLDDGVLLFGRRTWEHFARLWPSRTDPFAAAMNRARKQVVSSSSLDLEAWSNSGRLDEPLLDGVAGMAADRDVVVIGSTSVVRELQAAGAVDEYRLLTFPIVIAQPRARRLFDAPERLQLVSVDMAGPAVLSVLARATGT